MAMTYKNRNMENISKLADHTKVLALKWLSFCEKNNIDILVYSTIRSVEEQKANVAKGVSKTMKSYHIVGQALDFVPVTNGQADWNGYEKPHIKKAIAEAKRLGFEWGGDWKGFVDKPHLQYEYKGYGTDTFTFGKLVEPSFPKIGSKGEEVKEVQNLLIKNGYKVSVDGIFGQATHNAIVDFQKKRGLTVDGIVGHSTLTELKEAIPHKVIVPNVQYWQAKHLVSEYEGRYKCYGSALKKYSAGQTPKDADPYWFVIETDYRNAKQLVVELQTKGYSRTYGESIY